MIAITSTMSLCGVCLKFVSESCARFTKAKLWKLSLAAFLAFTAVKAAEDRAAESGNLPWEKGSVKVGGFVSTFDSTLTFGLENRGGVTLNAEDRLGLDWRLTVIRAEAMYG